MRSMVPLVDVMTGMISTSAVLDALFHRERSGEGQWLDVALLDVAVAATTHLSQNFLSTGRVPPRSGNGSLLFAPSNSYRCADGPLLIQIGNDNQWLRLCKALQCDEWLTNPQYATNAARMQHSAQLDAEIERVTAQLQRGELAQALGAAGVPCGPINTIAEAFDHPQVQHRGLRVAIEHPVHGQIPVVRSPFRFSATPVELKAPPQFGADTQQTLQRELGLSDAALAGLRDSGVL